MPAQVLPFVKFFQVSLLVQLIFIFPRMSSSQKLFDLIKNPATAEADCSGSVKAGNSTEKATFVSLGSIFPAKAELRTKQLKLFSSLSIISRWKLSHR